MRVLDLIRGDVERYREAHGFDVWFHKALWALIDYRVGHWARTDAPQALRPLLMAITLLSRKLLIETVTGIGIEPHARIGRRFYIAHFGGIFIHEDAVISDECQIAQGVVIGADDGGAPTIGNHVAIMPHAVLFGPITVGDHTKVGACAVVFQDLPAGCTAVGMPPSRIITHTQT